MSIKKCLSFLLSLIIFAEPLMVSAQRPSDTIAKVHTISTVQYADKKASICAGGNTKIPTELKALTTMFVIGAVLISSMKIAVEVGREIWFKRLCNNFSDEYATEVPGFIKIDTHGDDIKKQEGVNWCWNACLQRLLHKYDIDKTQKEIFRGITGKRYISAFKLHRTQANVVAYTRDEFDTTAKNNYKDPKVCKFLSRCVFNEEITKYVEKITEEKYTYQTLYVPWDKFSVDGDFGLDCGASICFYKICDKLKSCVVDKNQCEKTKVILKALCPIIKNSHAITIEDTKDDKFIIGEPQGGATVSLDNTKFFQEGSMLCDSDCRKEFIHGMPISFIIEKRKEITDNEWCEIIETCREETRQFFESREEKEAA